MSSTGSDQALGIAQGALDQFDHHMRLVIIDFTRGEDQRGDVRGGGRTRRLFTAHAAPDADRLFRRRGELLVFLPQPFDFIYNGIGRRVQVRLVCESRVPGAKLLQAVEALRRRDEEKFLLPGVRVQLEPIVARGDEHLGAAGDLCGLGRSREQRRELPLGADVQQVEILIVLGFEKQLQPVSGAQRRLILNGNDFPLPLRAHVGPESIEKADVALACGSLGMSCRGRDEYDRKQNGDSPEQRIHKIAHITSLAESRTDVNRTPLRWCWIWKNPSFSAQV